jgi:hypothetical protein
VALLAFVALQSGVHSVHHLTDAADSGCAVAAATAHTTGLSVDLISFDRPADPTIPAVPDASPLVVASGPGTPDLGRAPPTA